MDLVREYIVEKNAKYGDYRVAEYVEGEWMNECDGGWTKARAIKAKKLLESGDYSIEELAECPELNNA